MQRATAYQRGGKIFLHASSKTTAGVWILTKPVFAAEPTNASQLGQYVIDALNGSKEQVPHPTMWKGLFGPVLQLAGVKALNTFIKSAKCVEIELNADYVSFIPTRNLGVDEGFEPLDMKARQTAFGTPDNLGKALLAAFGDTE
jgi:hypothetical protein